MSRLRKLLLSDSLRKNEEARHGLKKETVDEWVEWAQRLEAEIKHLRARLDEAGVCAHDELLAGMDFALPASDQAWLCKDCGRSMKDGKADWERATYAPGSMPRMPR